MLVKPFYPETHKVCFRSLAGTLSTSHRINEITKSFWEEQGYIVLPLTPSDDPVPRSTMLWRIR